MVTEKNIMSREEWDQTLEESNPWVRLWFTDDEAAKAGGVTPRRLRGLQALGFIESVKAKRTKGPQMRMWSSVDMLAAALVDELCEQTGLSTGTVVSLLKLMPGSVLIDLLEEAESNANIATTGFDDWLTNASDVVSENGDVHIVIVNHQYIYLEGRWRELGYAGEISEGSDIAVIGVAEKFYSREPVIQALPANEPSLSKGAMLIKRQHPMSLHKLNLDLTLRTRIYQAVQAMASQDENRGQE